MVEVSIRHTYRLVAHHHLAFGTHSQCSPYPVMFLNSQITHMWRTVCISYVHCKFLQVRSACAFMTPKADAEQESILQRWTDVYIPEGGV